MTTEGKNENREIARFSILFSNAVLEVPDTSTVDSNWDIHNVSSQISLSTNKIKLYGSARLSPLESFLSLGPIGYVFVASFFQSWKRRYVDIPISEIVSVEVSGADGSDGNNAPSKADTVHLFTDNHTSGKKVFSFTFANNLNRLAPRSALWQFWLNLGTILPSDKLVIHTDELIQSFKNTTKESDRKT